MHRAVDTLGMVYQMFEKEFDLKKTTEDWVAQELLDDILDNI